jgi:hypothetical protein
MIEAAIHEAGRQTLRVIITLAAIATLLGIAIGYWIAG